MKLAYQSADSAFIGSIDVRIIIDDNTYILNNSKVSVDFAATSGAMSALDLKWEKDKGTDCYVAAKDVEFDDSYASAQKNVKVPANSKLDYIILTNEITGTVTFKCWVDNL